MPIRLPSLAAVLLPLALAACWENSTEPPAVQTRIVFHSARGAERGLALTSSSGARTMPLSTSGEDKPAWSPNGALIAFEAPNLAGYTDIWTLATLSGELEQVTDTPVRSERDPTWAPDGERLAYSARFFTEGVPEADSIVISDLEGKGASAVTPGTDPAWGPDGSIAFVDRSGEGSDVPAIWILAMDGRRTRLSPLTTEAVVDGEPAWSPGGRLAWTRRRIVARPGAMVHEEWSIMVQPTRGAPAVAILTDSAVVRAPAWSPDESELAVTATWTGTSELWILRADGSGRRRLTSSVRCTTPPCGNANPSWTR